MDHETEVIKHQMLETRTALTEKLEALEERVVSTVKDTTEAVEETVGAVKDAVESTVDNVKDTVTETVDTVKETVKETFDIHHQFEAHPWMMLGGATLVGYLGGCLLDSGRSACRAGSNGWSRLEGHGGRPEERPRPEPLRSEPAPSGPSLWDKAVEALGPAISKLEGLAIGAATGVVGKMLLEAAPEALRGDLEGVINDITRALGGKPIPDLQRPDDSAHPATGQTAPV
jgi:ElaB/YqjD/DUF883 family membrane-anchored ribosome-binding protein